MIKIDRREKELLRDNEWLLVYGRRKTGKTFLLKNSLDWNLYITITRGGSALVEYEDNRIELIGVKDLLVKIPEYIRNGWNIVIDEFQRLNEEYWDVLSVSKYSGKGRLVICGSSFLIAKKVFDRNSPLLGLFKPIHIDLIHPGDILREFMKRFPVKDSIKWGVIARDPWILGLIEPDGDIVDILVDNFKSLTLSASGLIGEVFEEEDRKLTRLYDMVLRLLALGYWSSDAIAQKLYESRLIQKPEMGIATGVLNQLYEMGFVDKVKLIYTRGGRIFYRHKSSLLSILLYIDERYGERDVKPDRNDIYSRLGIEIQFFIGEIMSRYKGLDRGYLIMPDREGDVDVILLHKGRPVIAYEVKIGEISESEGRKAVNNIRKYNIPRTGLISLSKEPPNIADEVIGPEKLSEIIEQI